MSERGGGVGGAAHETLGTDPVGGRGSAQAAEGQGAALGQGLGVGVDGQLGGAVVVGESEGECSVVGLDGLVAAADVEVAGALRAGGPVCEGDLRVAEVERSLRGGAADQTGAVRVVQVLGDFVTAALDWLGDLGEMAFDVPVQGLGGAVAQLPGVGVAPGVIAEAVGGFHRAGGGVDRVQLVRLGCARIGVVVAPLGARGAAGGGVLGLGEAVADLVVGVGGPVRGRAAECAGGGGGGAAGGLLCPGLGQSAEVVVAEALVVRAGAGGVRDGEDIAGFVVGVGVVLVGSRHVLASHRRGRQPLGTPLVRVVLVRGLSAVRGHHVLQWFAGVAVAGGRGQVERATDLDGPLSAVFVGVSDGVGSKVTGLGIADALNCA